MANPYDTLGRDFEERVLGGERASLSQPQTTLSDRLTSYAFHVQENAKTTGEALLVSDLLDAAKVLRTPPAAPAEEVWRPIATAPKDGTRILMSRAGENIGIYEIEINEWCSMERSYFEHVEGDLYRKVQDKPHEFWNGNGHRATHWMPLPTPPREGQTEDGR